MSLDNIQLPSILVRNMYSKTLVDLKTGKQGPASSPLPYLGNNQKRIAVIVTSDADIYLPTADLDFLVDILSACKLSMADIALINISGKPEFLFKRVSEELMAEKIFLFGVDPEQFGLPMQFPHYQVQHFNDQVYLSAVSFPELQNNKAEKLKLWNSLKKIFSPA